MIALDPQIADRLAKLCGLFGSNHDGERASAAAMADKLLRSHGLTWQQIIAVPSTIEQMIATALNHEHELTVWESGFIRGIRGRQHLTEKQIQKLRDIAERFADFRKGYST
jgi:hypothetical protein